MHFKWIYMDGMRYDLMVTYYENWVPKVKWYGWYKMQFNDKLNVFIWQR